MENELRDLEELSDGEIGPIVRSAVRVVGDKDPRAHLKPMNGDDSMDNGMEDFDDDDDDVVVKEEDAKSPKPSSDSKDAAVDMDVEEREKSPAPEELGHASNDENVVVSDDGNEETRDKKESVER